jgi:hypothetical protein
MANRAKSTKGASRQRRSRHTDRLLLLAAAVTLFTSLSTALIRGPAHDVEQTVSIEPDAIRGVVVILRSLDPAAKTLQAGIRVFDYWGLVGSEPNWSIGGIVDRYRGVANPAVIPLQGNPALYPFDVYETTLHLRRREAYWYAFYQDGMREFEYSASITTEPFTCCDISVDPFWDQASVSYRSDPPSRRLPTKSDLSPKVKLRIERPVGTRTTVLVIMLVLAAAICLPLIITDTISFLGVTASILLGMWGVHPLILPPSVTWPTLLQQLLITYYFWLFGLMFIRLARARMKPTRR